MPTIHKGGKWQLGRWPVPLQLWPSDSLEKMYTSSTAQGGDGSFKNRKPIGEIGCCESGMAERIHWWTEGDWGLLSFSLFLSLSLTISTYLVIISYLPIYLSICLPVYLSTCLSIYLSVCLSICLPVYLSICLSVYLSICLSVYLSIYLSLSLSVCLSVYLSTCLSVVQCHWV